MQAPLSVPLSRAGLEAPGQRETNGQMGTGGSSHEVGAVHCSGPTTTGASVNRLRIQTKSEAKLCFCRRAVEVVWRGVGGG